MKKHRSSFIVDMEWLVQRGKVSENWREEIMELGSKGKNKTHFMNHLGLIRDTFYKLMDRDPELRKIVKLALQVSEEWWVENARKAWEEEKSSKLNSQFFKYYMSNVYRDNWKVNIDITTDGEKLNNDNNIKIEILRNDDDED